LDVGCGLGHTLSLIHERKPKFDLLGVDIDPECLRQTKERVNECECRRIDDVADLFQTEPSASFDLIVMSHVLEHVLRPYDTVVGLLRLLKPDGILILAVPNPVRPDNIFYSLLRKYPCNKGHVQTWDRAHWRNFLENIVKANVIEYPTDYIRIPRLDSYEFTHRPLELLAKLFPGLSRSCIAVIRK